MTGLIFAGQSLPPFDIGTGAIVFRLLADLVAEIHFGFILFVLFGALLVVRWRGLLIPHLAAVAWGAMIEFGGWICPLTPLENHLRYRAGLTPYGGDFVQRYLLSVMYPAGLTRKTQLLLGLIVLAINAVAYTVIFFRRNETSS